jgi:hypothetical protein
MSVAPVSLRATIRLAEIPSRPNSPALSVISSKAGAPDYPSYRCRAYLPIREPRASRQAEAGFRESLGLWVQNYCECFLEPLIYKHAITGGDHSKHESSQCPV